MRHFSRVLECEVEEFREFILRLLNDQDTRFKAFHEAVNENSQAGYRKALETIRDRELKKWLKLYLAR